MTRISFEIPELYTDRLILREPRLEDLPHVAAFFQTERSHFVGGPHTENGSWRSISNALGHWYLNGYGMWAVHHKADDRAIGSNNPRSRALAERLGAAFERDAQIMGTPVHIYRHPKLQEAV